MKLFARTHSHESAPQAHNFLNREGLDRSAQFQAYGEPLSSEIIQLQKEGDPELRSQGLLNAAIREEVRGKPAFATEAYAWLMQHGTATVREKAQERLELLEGQGAFGQRAEQLLRGFAQEASDPVMLLAMGVGGSVYKATKLATMSRLVGSSGYLGRGVGMKLAGSVAGYALEAPVFTAVGRWGRGEKLLGPGLKEELLSSYLVLGAMKTVGGVSRGISRGLGSPRLEKVTGDVGLYGGIMLGHKLETVVGLREWHGGGQEWADGLAMFFQLKASGRILNRLGGESYRGMERELDYRAKHLAEWGDIQRAKAANDGSYPIPEPAANGPHREAAQLELKLAAGAEWGASPNDSSPVRRNFQVLAGDRSGPGTEGGQGRAAMPTFKAGRPSSFETGAESPGAGFPTEILSCHRGGSVPSGDALLWMHKALVREIRDPALRDRLALSYRSIQGGDLAGAWEGLREIVEAESEVAEWLREGGHITETEYVTASHEVPPAGGESRTGIVVEISRRNWVSAQRYDYHQQKDVERLELDELNAAWLAGGGKLQVRSDALLPEILQRLRDGLPVVDPGEAFLLRGNLWGDVDLRNLQRWEAHYRGNDGQVELFRDLSIVLNRPRLGMINSNQSWGDSRKAKEIFARQEWNKIPVRWQEYLWYRENVDWDAYRGTEGYDRMTQEMFDGNPFAAFKVANYILGKTRFRTLQWGAVQRIAVEKREPLRAALVRGLKDGTLIGPEGYDRFALEQFSGNSALAFSVARSLLGKSDFESLGWVRQKRSTVQEQGEILATLRGGISEGTFLGPDGYVEFAKRHFGGDAMKAYQVAQALLSPGEFAGLQWGAMRLTPVTEQTRLLAMLRAGIEDGSLKGIEGYVRFAELECFGNLQKAYRVARSLLGEDDFPSLQWGSVQFMRAADRSRIQANLRSGLADGSLVGIQGMQDFADREFGGSVFKAGRSAKQLLSDSEYERLSWSIRAALKK